MAKPTIYDLLAKQGIDDITIAQLNTATSNSAVDEASIEFWKGPIVLQRVLQMRTYPWGLPIPEQSKIVSQAVNPGDTLVLQPSGTELWNVIAIAVTAAAGTATVSVNMYDGTTDAMMHSSTVTTTASVVFPWESPIPLTNTVFMRVSNTDLTNPIQVQVAYHKVGL